MYTFSEWADEMVMVADWRLECTKKLNRVPRFCTSLETLGPSDPHFFPAPTPTS